ncbi:hypothetical protein GEMRC1_013269 [Eukaryota sp. GEM-RC1]
MGVIEDLDQHIGEPLKVSAAFPFDKYISTARTLLSSAIDSYAANDYTTAYIKFKRFLFLAAFTIPKHPSASTNPGTIKSLQTLASKAAEFVTVCKLTLQQQQQQQASDVPSFEDHQSPEMENSPLSPSLNDISDPPPSAQDFDLSSLDAPPSQTFSSSDMYQPSDNSDAPPKSSLFDLDPSFFTPASPAPSSTHNGFSLLYNHLLTPSITAKTVSLDPKQIRWPTSLVASFLSHIVDDVNSNTESCGLLCANSDLNCDPLSITHLILPEQTGTAESCTVTNETSLIPAIEDNNLVIVGWIHTHPTQTAFLSAIDLHTHLGLQQSFPSSIAIVVSLREGFTKPVHKSFSLTDMGLSEVGSCKRGGFHSHSSGVFDEAKNSVEVSDGYVTVLDLR